MRRWLVLPLLISACGPVQSSQVGDQIKAMVGMSETRVLSCMGPPTSKDQSGPTTVWTYDTNGAIITTATVSGDRNLAVGSMTTNREFCHINLTMQGGTVIAANYRSQGKLLSPSLPCYTVLHACVPDPSTAAAARQEQTDKAREAVDFCKELYQDSRLDPLRSEMAFGTHPTLSMQTNAAYPTNEQRSALDVYGTLLQQCREKMASLNPRAWKVVVQVDQDPMVSLKSLYERKITFGEYNTHREEMLGKMQAAFAGQPQ